MNIEIYGLMVKPIDPDNHNPSHEEINKNLGAMLLEVNKGEGAWFAYKHPDGTWHRVQTSPVKSVTWFDSKDTIMIDTENSCYIFSK